MIHRLADRETLLRGARFLVVGGGSAAVQFGVLALIKGRMNDTVAFTISWMLSTMTHYLANRFWALPSGRHDPAKQFGEYLFTIAVSWVINVAAFTVCQRFFDLGLMWATFWAIPPSTVVVFLLLNYRVFRARPDDAR
ncbi:MAG: GtrA family protein [Verrucomicrobia bacterium]|nr:GtrA family protein [Verrucomicrobiota bacterium]